MNEVFWLIFILFLLLVKGFFAGSEMALANADKLKLQHKAKQGHRGALLVIKLSERPEVLQGTVLAGSILATALLVTLSTLLMLHYFGAWGGVYILLLGIPLFTILGEVVPRSVSQQKSDVIAPIVVHPLHSLALFFYPIFLFFSRLSRLLVRLFNGARTEQSVFVTREQIYRMAERVERGTHRDMGDQERIKRAIRFADTTVREAMIPMTEIVAIERNGTTRDAIMLVRQRGFNRLPVYEGHSGNIIGIVTLTTWDLMDPMLPDRSLETLIKPTYYVSPHQAVDQLLPILRKRDDHLAIVVDEFGAAVGMITMEDILEEVMGEIDVGFDFDEYLPPRQRSLEKLDEEVYRMDSRLSLSEVNRVLQVSLPTKEAHTLGGLVMARLRCIPRQGDNIIESGYRFTVEESTDNGSAEPDDNDEPSWHRMQFKVRCERI